LTRNVKSQTRPILKAPNICPLHTQISNAVSAVSAKTAHHSGDSDQWH